MLGGAALGTFALFLIGILGAGTDSIAGYLNTLRNPWINFSVEMMPSLHGLVATLGAGSPVEIGLTGFVVLAFVWICMKSDDFEFLFALCMVCSLLVSYHSGIADGLILLLGYVLVESSTSASKALKVTWGVLLTPLPYALGASIGVPLLLLGLLSWVALSLASRRALSPVGMPVTS